MKKQFPVILGSVVIILFVILAVMHFLPKPSPAENVQTEDSTKTPTESTPIVSTPSKSGAAIDATYVLDDHEVTLVNGVSEVEAAPGSASKIVTRYFGNEVKHDIDGDGREDTVFILTQNSGGTGTVYYVVAALNRAGGYLGTHGFILGDRIAPQTLEISSGNVFVVNYADRKEGESFDVAPSEGKSVWLFLDQDNMRFANVGPNFKE